MRVACADSRTVVVDGVRVRYHVAGEGRDGVPVVLLHGGGLDEAALSWRETFPALADVRPVYALDWPGYGGSDRPDAPYSIPYYRDTLAGFLDAVGLDRVALVGVSMGGGAALGYTLDAPDRVDRLVLVDSYGLGGRIPGGPLGYLFTRLPFVTDLAWAALRRSRLLLWVALRGIVGSGDAVTPALLDDAVRAVRRGDAGRSFTAFQRSEVGPTGLRTNYVDRLPDLTVPTLVVHGEADPLVPVAWAVRAGTLIPDATTRVLPDCGHWPPRECPDRFLELVEEFLLAE
ncbi:alpha/beta fold hydrolase [Halobaculum litoreum]|uniref:Alpha/beta fold hydrolase n=1 Tax=Halobaculum litoreum TaxID=3031998 RepID=A0ABD5XPR5_9EURY|nr:alpha/beta fold hydrolase [Halobaculum sp. DT92]